MIREHTVEIDGLRLRYAEGDDAGPPLVLLHGALLGWEEFLPLLPELAPRWRVLAPDFSGHGGSARRERYTFGAWLEETAGFLASRVGAPAVIAGHSLGGFVGMGLASRYPDRVAGLALLDSFINLDTFLAGPFPAFFAALAALEPARHGVDDLARRIGEIPVQLPGHPEPASWGALPGMDPAVRRYLASSVLRSDPAVLSQILSGSALADYDPGALLADVACPTLLVQADPAVGGMLTDADVARARPHLAGATCARLDGVGHLLHLQDPAPVGRALLWFLESLRGASTAAL
ncbi:MAG TPA: alpha/beta hydrolase [Gemmatimonadota bacterium]|jgi:pimeloyl-ACP methyl ester carboxylesterase